MTADELGSLSREEFAAALGGVAEGSPWVAEGAWERRPFRDAAQVARAFADAVAAAPAQMQDALIRAHPDLAGRLAVAGGLAPLSAAEQAGAGLDRLPPDVHAEMTRLNAAYRDRFGFPFVICVRDHTRDGILTAMRERLANTPGAERDAALGEIARIMALRIGDVVT